MTVFESYTTNDDGYREIYGNYWKGECFTVGTTGSNEAFDLSTVEFLLYRVGSPGTITCYLFADSGGYPTGAALASGTTDGNSITTSSAGEWVSITMSAYECQASTKYHLLLKCAGATSANEIRCRLDTSSPTYSGGSFVYSDDGGSNYVLGTHDVLFIVNGTAVGGDVTVEPGALTLSTTEETPTYFAFMSPSVLGLTATLQTPSASVPTVVSVGVLSLSLSVQSPTIDFMTLPFPIINGTGTKGTRYISKNYPITSGLGDDDKHSDRIMNLVAEEGSSVPYKERVLI